MGESNALGKAGKLCREIMSTDVTTASPETPLREIAVIMRDGDIGVVPLVENGALVGIVTDRDIVVRALAQAAGPDSPASVAMTRELFTVKPETAVFEALRIMREQQVRRLPVVNTDGTLAGIIALADIALEMEDEREIAETLEDISSGFGFWSKKR
jgi:CBS domain-containing protein